MGGFYPSNWKVVDATKWCGGDWRESQEDLSLDVPSLGGLFGLRRTVKKAGGTVCLDPGGVLRAIGVCVEGTFKDPRPGKILKGVSAQRGSLSPEPLGSSTSKL